MNQPAISSDGLFVIYAVYNDPVGVNNKRYVIKSSDTKWQREYWGASSAQFSGDSKWALIQQNPDTLTAVQLGTEKVNYLTGIKSFRILPDKNGRWIICGLTKPEGDVMLYDLGSGQKKIFHSVLEYQVSNNGEDILFKESNPGNGGGSFLELWNIEDDKPLRIWQGSNAGNFIFNKSGDQLSFFADAKAGDVTSYELMYYKKGMKIAIEIPIHLADSTLRLSNSGIEFGPDDRSLILNLQSSKQQKPKSEGPAEIWRYNEDLLSIHRKGRNQQGYSALIRPETSGTVLLLTQSNESIQSINGDFALVLKRPDYEALFESFWNQSARDIYHLVNLKTGERKLIDVEADEETNMGLSPEGKWIIYFDSKKKSFFSYEISTGVITDITRDAPTNWIKSEEEMPGVNITWSPTSRTWIDHDEAVLIYDEFDIWQIDPRGIKEAINLTKGMGSKFMIKFKLLKEGPQLESIRLSQKPSLILVAFNKRNKDNGFYKLPLGTGKEPELLSMGPYFYYWTDIDYSEPPLQAKLSNTYIIKRMGPNECPNFFITKDFKTFKQLSDLQPQRHYNWMNVELMRWQNADGREATGLLYKPENFNPDRRYPVIIHYYEKRTDELNLFIRPQASEGGINIPYFVSNGYIVFVPDIHYKIGSPGESASNSIIGAARYLRTFSWIDSTRMGLQGHSFGGYETNYTITKTNIFACAVSTSGICNLVSFYGSAAREGYPMYWSEKNQGRLGSTIWQNPDAYVKNSPIFYADKITTPLLIIHNRSDDVVPFSQGLEFYTALRRLHKKTWLVQYDNNRHVIEGNSAKDYTLRMKEFFDHFLYGLPVPTWMQ
ncbi:MAG: prolyl oligopeptidase family serine peptidase [Chitinophagaceae bacterium]